MLQKIKKIFYFTVAWYFRIFAEIRLRIWNPRVIVVMGSTGKTTLLHLIESQLGGVAKYSHHANSSIGLPFDILGLKRKTLTFSEWPMLFILAPFKLFTSLPKENIYVAEVDCDRPYEGKFLSTLLRPHITLWTNVGRAHSMNFDNLIESKKFSGVESAIAREFGYILETTRSFVLVNSDEEFLLNELKRTKATIEKISIKELKDYAVTNSGTSFKFEFDEINFNYLLPKETATSLLMSKRLVEYLGFKFDKKFKSFILPPGRSSVFKGIKDITIVDSAYNANFASMKVVIEMFSKLKSKTKWIVIGDMLEQGKGEEEEHKKLAALIKNQNFNNIILMGPRVSKYTYPILANKTKKVVAFETPKEVLVYLQENIKGGETILFKGARFLEGVIENLLSDKRDAKNLDRREKAWEIRRKKWGL